jgi:transcription-repair coupling factor (superfamily II helicase)
MIDRFGPLPDDVRQLLKLIGIKVLCRRAHVEKVEAGPKGVIIAFRDNSFANPEGLVRYLAEQGPEAKVRPDMKIVFMRDFDSADQRLEGTRVILRTLVGIAEAKQASKQDNKQDSRQDNKPRIKPHTPAAGPLTSQHNRPRKT